MSSKSFSTAFCLFYFHLSALAQTADTLYFDKSWHSCKKDEANYFRLIKNIDSLYQIQDFYLNGVLQMQGLATSLDPEILEGQCSYYYPNGIIKSQGVYKKNNPIGLWSYYNGKGKLTSTYRFVLPVNNKMSEDNIPKNEYIKAISETDRNFSFTVRGKLFGFFIIEDTYFSTATLGTEFLIKGRHSLGVDFTYFGWQYEKDNTKDEALYETYERRAYAYIDYKYRFLSYKRVDFYINIYDKIGTYHMWQEGVTEEYTVLEKPWLNDKTDGTFNQIGAGLGFKSYFSERFYLDISVNGGKLFSNNNSSIYDATLQTTNKLYNVKSDKNIFYIRINFGYKLFIKKKQT